MRVLVSDTSVIIDLERGHLLDTCFKLPFEFCVPDLLYRRELEAYGGPALIDLGLRVEGLTNAELTDAQALRNGNMKLSLPDAFAFSLAKTRGYTLLTGDGELRSVARDAKIPFFGVLWVADQIFDGQLMKPHDLADCLQAIGDHQRCRLPKAEIRDRLNKFRC